MEGTLSSRDKNDIFWIKKRRYMVSADIKCKTEGGYFNPDMAAEVKSAYERYDERMSLYELTGNEFMDHPPTASGQISFAKSIAMMMHTLDTIDSSVSDETGAADFTAAFFMDIVEDAKVLIREIIDAFFTGCGVDSEGNEFSDREKKDAAQKEFFDKRKEYEMLIKTERRIAEWDMMDIIRETNWIDEEMETDETGEDPNLINLIKENKDAADRHKKEIESLCEISRKALIEAASLTAGKMAMFEPVKRKLEDESLNEGSRRLVRGAFDSYLFDVDMRLRGLKFRSEAAYYMVRWLLLNEPVDEIIAERIAQISENKPSVIDGDVKLLDIPGYKPPKEGMAVQLPECDDLNTLSEMGDRVRRYVQEHPFQFEAQCLLSIVENLDGLSEILPVSWALVQAIDMLTRSERYAEFSEEDRQKIFDNWVLADLVCSIGYSITETIVENPEKTVQDATDTLRSMAQMLSYSIAEKKVRNTLAQVVMERSGLRVY